MADIANKGVSGNRQKVLDRMRGRYPDKKFDDDEVLYGQISDDYDDYDKKIGGYKEKEQALLDMFTKDPRSAAFLTNWRKGGDPVVELVRQFGTDIKDAIDDPDRLDAIADANKEYVERVAREKKLDEEYQSNLAESLQTLEKFQQERGLSDDEIDNIMEFLVGIMKDGIMGKFSVSSMEMARKALNHDTDVADTGQEGEVRGKNARIDEKLRKQDKGDGTARLDGKNGKAGGKITRSLGALDNFGDGSQTIWERGGERRTKINRE